MKPRLLLFLIILSACSSKNKTVDLNELTGYWEIEKVVFPDGQEKVYGLNTSIEYFLLDGQSGFRKKVQPQLDGQYLTSDDAQRFSISQLENQEHILVYVNEGLQWQEKLDELTADRLILISDQEVIYVYKRYIPLDL